VTFLITKKAEMRRNNRKER